MIKMKLRLAKKKDLKEITNIYKETIKDRFLNFPTVYINRMIQRNQVAILEHDKKIIGCYIWKINKVLNPNTMKRAKHTIVWLEQIMVRPGYQNKGFGNKMMAQYLSFNVREFRLVCKEDLIRYYKRYDFEVIESIISDKQQKVIMSKTAKSI